MVGPTLKCLPFSYARHKGITAQRHFNAYRSSNATRRAAHGVLRPFDGVILKGFPDFWASGNFLRKFGGKSLYWLWGRLRAIASVGESMDGTFLTKNREDRKNSSDDLFIKPPQVNLQKFNLLRLLLLVLGRGRYWNWQGKAVGNTGSFINPDSCSLWRYGH